ncbi:bifunctional hydroxymethylpyrimidine kinase/phosphomethylpyrimidine kinase [Rhizosphaericola mali]|uniref:hydroxymethylpyrimidine kinase n=1 Tax=Rhizosphaericola mali TaxID=2545455 RepID=A0A5P2FYZ2_9BACT|nr:bifunctional hydroxymethylpyrimidine kinase/phosphomethylpyrimidine kinase [Rhizosphaericola mali]QES88147.1 bifunctional hydroxymethylpyrimidine kinase/phosphomethylpyrimidine kinase [Rhizosphaericola mali]
MKKYTYPSVMTIAGFDGSGGAGIQADIKTISALGCFATSVLTALPVQNTTGVKHIFPIPIEAVKLQIETIMEDIMPDSIKIGMVHTSELAITIVDTLKKFKKVPIVFDPVMVATSGHRLIEDDTIEVMIEKLFPIADIITPNMDEIAILANCKVDNLEEMILAGEYIKKLGCKNILLKGGHLPTEKLTSILLTPEEIKFYSYDKVLTNNTHGSGCTLSSAIASYLALGYPTNEAVYLGQEYVFNAISNGADVLIGKGNGPLNHFYKPQKLVKNEMVRS